MRSNPKYSISLTYVPNGINLYLEFAGHNTILFQCFILCLNNMCTYFFRNSCFYQLDNHRFDNFFPLFLIPLTLRVDQVMSYFALYLFSCCNLDYKNIIFIIFPSDTPVFKAVSIKKTIFILIFS